MWTAFGVRPRQMWDAVWQPCAPDSAMVMGLWRELSAAVAVVGGVGELTPQPAAAVAKHECTLLHASHPEFMAKHSRRTGSR